MKPALLLQVTRANITEREHYGFVMLVDKNENIISNIGNDNNEHFFMRSCAKPFQALPILTSKTFTNFNLTLKELAVCSASHSGSFEHLETIKSVLNKAGLTEDNLKCYPHEPADLEMQKYLIKNDLKPTKIHNNCSGKHAGMLAVCVNNRWDTETYLEDEHPLQKEILKIADKYCNCQGNINISIDNCSTPMYGMPFAKMGAGYLKLFLGEEASLIKDAFSNYPAMVGAEGHLDSSVMDVSNGKLISKIGAEALCIIINTQEEQALIVKSVDGNNNSRAVITIEALKQLGWLSEEELTNKNIKKLFNKEVKSLDGRLVGRVNVMFELKKSTTARLLTHL